MRAPVWRPPRSILAAFLVFSTNACLAETVPDSAFDSIPAESVASPIPAIDEAVLSSMKEQKLVGLSVAVVREGELTYLRGYGWEDHADGALLTGAGSKIRWASVSKTVTGTLSALAAERGEIDLDRDIREIYAEYELPPNAGAAISQRQLLGHLAGIQDYVNGETSGMPPVTSANDPGINTGMEWALKYWIGNDLIAQPGERYSYSTHGFNLAGVVLEHAVGRRFHEEARERVFDPFEMGGISPDYQWEEIAGRAKGYVKLSNGTVVVDSDWDVSWKLAGGGYLSSARDMGLWCRGLMGSEILSAGVRSELWTSQADSTGALTGYGLGFSVSGSSGRRKISHAGSQEKTSSLLVFYPDEGLCVALLSNSRGAKLSALEGRIESAFAATQASQERASRLLRSTRRTAR